MAQVATMSVRFAADIAGFEKNVTKAERTFLRSAKSMIDMGKTLSLELTAPFLAISGVMAKSAADAEASMARFTRMFGPATDQMQAFAKQMEKVIPVTDEDMKSLLATTQQFISQLGLAPQAALDMTKSLTKLAGDIAAFRGIDVTQVMDALEHGMAGRTQGLITLGIAINKVAVEQEALKLGLIQVGEKMTVAAQSQATMALVMEKTANITGQAAAMAGNAANSIKFLHQASVAMAVEWGNVLLPYVVKLVHGLTDIAHWMATASDSTKLLVLGIGGIVAVGGPALLVIGSLIRSLTELEKVVRIVTGAEGLMALATGGAVIVAVLAGLAAIGAAFYASGADARRAQSEIDSYKQSLQGLSAAQAGQALIGANARVLDATGKLNTMTPSKVPDWLRNGLGMSVNPYNAQARLVGTLLQQQTDARSAYNGAIQGILFDGGGAVAGGAGKAGKVRKAGKSPIDALAAQADTLLKLQPELQSGWSGLDQLGQKQLDTYARLTGALAAQTDQYSDQAIKLRDLIVRYQQLQAVQLATGTSMMTPQSFMGVTQSWSDAALNVDKNGNAKMPLVSSSSPFKNIDIAHLPGVEGKLDTLGGIFKDSIASQAQFIAQSLTTVLGIKQANAGGAIGSVIGGAVGKGIGTAAIGSAAGAIAGSVVPVVGTVIGSIVGGLIGNAIGGLFGGGGASNNASGSLNSLATAAQKVTAALSNVPTGFKIALERFRVSDPSAIPFGASLPAGYGPAGVTITGDVHVYGVQDIKGLYTQITAYARGQGVRGGTTQWQLASSPAGI